MNIDQARELAQLAATARAQIGTDAEEGLMLRLRERGDDLGPAVHALLEAGEHDVALTMAGALSVFWQDSGMIGQGREITAAVLAAAEDTASAPYARAQLALGELAFRQGDQDGARDATVIAKEVAQQAGDDWAAGRAEINLARVAFRDGDASQIIEHAHKAQALAGDDERMHAAAIHMLGWGQYTGGDVTAAIDHFEQNVATYRDSGDRVGQAAELANIADLLAERGDIDGAAKHLRDALEVPGVYDNHYLAPSLVRSAGVVAAMRGDHETALELIGAADAFYDRFGLEADPGDDVPHDVMHATVEAVGKDRADEICARGAAWSLPEALRAAAAAL